jgi:predicted transcriptional regulator
VRPISPDLQDGGVSQTAVAGYIAKYATKDAQIAGGLDRRIRYMRQIELADVSEHARRLMLSRFLARSRLRNGGRRGG